MARPENVQHAPAEMNTRPTRESARVRRLRAQISARGQVPTTTTAPVGDLERPVAGDQPGGNITTAPTRVTRRPAVIDPDLHSDVIHRDPTAENTESLASTVMNRDGSLNLGAALMPATEEASSVPQVDFRGEKIQVYGRALADRLAAIGAIDNAEQLLAPVLNFDDIQEDFTAQDIETLASTMMNRDGSLNLGAAAMPVTEDVAQLLESFEELDLQALFPQSSDFDSLAEYGEALETANEFHYEAGFLISKIMDDLASDYSGFASLSAQEKQQYVLEKIAASESTDEVKSYLAKRVKDSSDVDFFSLRVIKLEEISASRYYQDIFRYVDQELNEKKQSLKNQNVLASSG